MSIELYLKGIRYIVRKYKEFDQFCLIVLSLVYRLQD